jgi:hypothetical protein
MGPKGRGNDLWSMGGANLPPGKTVIVGVSGSTEAMERVRSIRGPRHELGMQRAQRPLPTLRRAGFESLSEVGVIFQSTRYA